MKYVDQGAAVYEAQHRQLQIRNPMKPLYRLKFFQIEINQSLDVISARSSVLARPVVRNNCVRSSISKFSLRRAVRFHPSTWLLGALRGRSTNSIPALPEEGEEAGAGAEAVVGIAWEVAAQHFFLVEEAEHDQRDDE